MTHETLTHGDPCPGPCNHHYRNPTRIDIQHDQHGTPLTIPLDHDGEPIQPAPGQPIWCRPCQDHIRTRLTALPGLAAQLLLRTDGHLNAGRDTNTTRTGTRDGGPTASPAWDAVEAVAAWAQDWRDELRERLGHADRPGWGEWPGSVSHARNLALAGNVTYLTAHLTALLSWPDRAEDAGLSITRQHKALEKAAGLDRLRHRLPAPCPSCDRRTLARDDGDEQVTCGACGRTWLEADYRRLTVVLASELAG